jgi:hypothetical protein
VVSHEVAERIDACTDTDQLNTWIRSACTAERIEDIFGS